MPKFSNPFHSKPTLEVPLVSGGTKKVLSKKELAKAGVIAAVTVGLIVVGYFWMPAGSAESVAGAAKGASSNLLFGLDSPTLWIVTLLAALPRCAASLVLGMALALSGTAIEGRAVGSAGACNGVAAAVASIAKPSWLAAIPLHVGAGLCFGLMALSAFSEQAGERRMPLVKKFASLPQAAHLALPLALRTLAGLSFGLAGYLLVAVCVLAATCVLLVAGHLCGRSIAESLEGLHQSGVNLRPAHGGIGLLAVLALLELGSIKPY